MNLSNDFNAKLVVRNLGGLATNFHAANARLLREVRDAVGNAAARLTQRTIDLCPKRTFYMSEHVRTDFSPQGLTCEVGWDAEDFVGTTDEHGHPRAFYPPYVELGTRHMAAQPSLSIASIEEEPRFKAELSEAIRRALA